MQMAPAQDWNRFPGGDVINSTEYLGARAGSTVPLQIKTVPDLPIEWWTENARRMRLSFNETYGIGSFPNQQKFGSLLLCPKVDGLYNNGAKGPFSLLHLAGDDHNAQQASYRPWMNVGVNFTDNNDQDYIGQKARELDYTDMVAHWSDNPGEHLKDRFRFLFTSGYDAHATTGAQSEEGLEFLRMWAAKYDDPRIGIGDWYAANLADPVNVTEPSERLDIVNGRVRIRQLPTDPEANTLDQYMVVDNTGVVKWRHLPVVPPPTTCDWSLNPGVYNNVSTAFGPTNPNCPDEWDAVGIGMDLGAALAAAKLNVASTTIPWGINVDVAKPASNPDGATLYGQKIKVTVPNYADAWGLSADVTGHGYRTRGLHAITRGSNYVSWAGDFIADAAASYSVGVHGSSTSGTYHSVGVHGVSTSETTGNYGTVGEVRGSQGTIQIGLYGRQWSSGLSWINPPNGNYGVFATTEQSNLGVDWAGWFNGNVNVTGLGYIPGGTWISSDENLKENVTDLSNALGVIDLLNPKSYDYLVEEYPQLGLPTGQQYGFLAQELEQAIPEAVKDITFQATLDSAGQVLYPALSTKIINTDAVIPFLVAAIKEQQQQIAAMQAQIAQCCAANPGMAPGETGGLKAAPATGEVKKQDLLIIPNPVADLTTLEYYVPRAGKVVLQVATMDGKPLATLREEMAEPGAYSYTWNTSKLATGTYLCTYLLDGAVVVQRAVKVQ